MDELADVTLDEPLTMPEIAGCGTGKLLLKKSSNDPEKEKDQGMDALGEIFNHLSDIEQERVLKLSTYTEEEQIQALRFLENFTVQASLPSPEISPFEEIKSRYKTFEDIHSKQKMTAKNIVSHLKAQLGGDLKSFGAEEDRIYLDDLRKIEPFTDKMYNKLYYEHGNDASVKSMKEIIPKKTEKVTKRLKNFKVTNKTPLNEYHRNKSAEYARIKLAEKTNTQNCHFINEM